ncbi:hypothetical protein L596_015281 [Steinernema carpocapsae]|uniref:MRH domain-containing protein n=1 Tax=Steinernema carpocapsae TaxID=34508 RepID=A0A4U5NFU1_STECR|nr:hypothetical protein L596_015281 [Steinernema carpocapsae]
MTSITVIELKGELCSLTGKPRYTELNLVCNNYAPEKPFITVSEEKTCRYKISVRSDMFCDKHVIFDAYGLNRTI